MWRILGRRRNGDQAYINIDVTPEDEVAVKSDDGEAVLLTPSRTRRLWLAIGQAANRVAFGRKG